MYNYIYPNEAINLWIMYIGQVKHLKVCSSLIADDLQNTYSYK